MAGHLAVADPLASTRGVHVTPFLTYGYLGGSCLDVQQPNHETDSLPLRTSGVLSPHYLCEFWAWCHDGGCFMFVMLLEYETVAQSLWQNVSSK